MIFNPYAKVRPIRSKDYKEFIASCPCLVCGQKAQPHHESIGYKGTATKVSDIQCIPLSKEWHTINPKSRHRHPGGKRGFYEEFNIDPLSEMLRLINYFIANGGKFNG